MAWHDNREFMEALRASGDLVVVPETVSWDLELGAMSRLACERDAPALFAFPAPMLHEGDGGRYIGTWDLVVSRALDTKWTNWGIYRFMLHGKRTLTGFPRPTSHLGKVFQEQFVPTGRPMPI